MLVVRSPIYLANYPVDFRKAINGLMVIVVEAFGHNPTTTGAYYVFCNRLRDKLKVLYWDGNGFALWHKRLEQSRFQFHYRDDEQLEMTADQFQWLLSGLDWQKTIGLPAKEYAVLVWLQGGFL